jgi:hypothetical protein
MSTPTEITVDIDDTTGEQLHERADRFVSGMDRAERVVWLQRQGFTDRQILDALLDPEDADLDEFCRDAAHGVAAEVANGSTGRPAWLV